MTDQNDALEALDRIEKSFVAVDDVRGHLITDEFKTIRAALNSQKPADTLVNPPQVTQIEGPTFEFSGYDETYRIKIGTKELYSTKDKRDAQLFLAQINCPYQQGHAGAPDYASFLEATSLLKHAQKHKVAVPWGLIMPLLNKHGESLNAPPPPQESVDVEELKQEVCLPLDAPHQTLTVHTAKELIGRVIDHIAATHNITKKGG